MDGKSWRGLAILNLLLVTGLWLALATPSGAQSAPDFTLKDVISGQPYSLSQLRGKVVMLNFFTFTCEPCKKEMPDLNQIDQEFKSQGFQMIGIGLASTPEQLRAIAQQFGLNYPVLLGDDAVSKAYGKIEFVPASFIIDRQGNIVHKIMEARSKAEFIKLIKPLL
jgi:peroxiredoxin